MSRTHAITRPWISLAAAAALAFTASSASASKVGVHVLETYGDFAAGEFDGTSLSPDGEVVLGPTLATWAKELPGPVLSLTEGEDGRVYVAVQNPGRVFRVEKGQAPTLVAEFEEPLVTKVLPWGSDQLVAVVGPKAHVAFINLKSRPGKNLVTKVPLPEVEVALDAAVLGTTLYIVGGGEEGVLMQLKPGASKAEVVAKVEEKMLRSVSARKTRRGEVVLIGSAAKGLVYRLEGKKLRTVLDAAASEVVDLAIDDDGAAFAAIVDAEGNLSAGALAAAKQDAEEKPEGEKAPAKPEKSRPRKVSAAEVWRIDVSGEREILWQSKKHGVYSLFIEKDGVLLGTGASGRVYRTAKHAGTRATLLTGLVEHEEIVDIAGLRRGRVVLGTAHSSGVVELASAARSTGAYLSPSLDAHALATRGALSWRGEGAFEVQVRTGNTRTPDDSWTGFSPPLKERGAPVVPPGRFAQVRFKLAAKGVKAPALRFARWSYLPKNRAPVLAGVDVVGAGWKVEPTRREPDHERSVSFGRGAFEKFGQQRGSLLPSLGERGNGKQTFERGYRTVYAYAEDGDRDVLRYRFSLAQVDAGGTPKWTELKAWSTEPFVSFDASTLRDGRYRVKVEVDDMLTNGPARVLSDVGETPDFAVAHRGPRFEGASASRGKGGIALKLAVKADQPLSVVKCAAGGGEWLPIDPEDGILDTTDERFSATLPGAADFDSVSCLAVDEALNEARTDIIIR